MELGTSKIEELGRRAVACARWRWMPGMRVLTYDAGHRYGQRVRDDGAWSLGIDPLPDLTDPATRGALLALVREAWGWTDAFVCHDEVAWYLSSGETGCCVELQDEAGDGERYDTEAEALVAALEAAP